MKVKNLVGEDCAPQAYPGSEVTLVCSQQTED